MPQTIPHPGDLDHKFVPAPRIEENLVAAAERRTLLFLAARTPRCIDSDHLTLLGFVSQCLAGACYALARPYPAMLLVGIVFLALNWLGDSLDGTLARFRNRQRPRYGFYVDHITDTIGALFLMGGLALSGFVHPIVALGMLIAFLMLSIESYLATYTLGCFRLSHWMFGPTEIRILLAVGNLALFRNPRVHLFHRRLLLFDLGGSVAILGMMAMIVVSAIQHTVQLDKEEKIA